METKKFAIVFNVGESVSVIEDRNIGQAILWLRVHESPELEERTEQLSALGVGQIAIAPITYGGRVRDIAIVRQS